jgi:hypothetical protein
MKTREWTEYLDEGFILTVRLTTESGKVTNFAVVLIRGDEMITRWDCAHGTVHRDIYGRHSALIDKDFRVSLSKAEGFIYALRDLKENFRRYFAFFEAC